MFPERIVLYKNYATGYVTSALIRWTLDDHERISDPLDLAWAEKAAGLMRYDGLQFGHDREEFYGLWYGNPALGGPTS